MDVGFSREIGAEGIGEVLEAEAWWHFGYIEWMVVEMGL